ncbi:hypothetical protein RJ640_013045 [Escallonia rubra]|uniref:Chloroplast lumen common family protein n=1 Tax=Escallonia rubra TaxID=112253 RepID=A0AA88SIS7_9ASTE|nr:hypothetical protein RJ640_013045 [Escallonia rubra]
MVGSSINAFSVYSHSPLHYPKLHARTPLNPAPTKLSFSLQIPPLNCHLLKYSPQPLNLFKRMLPSPNHSPQKQISKFFSEKIAVVLLGSFLFMGGFNTRPILAQPVQESSYNENMEQKRDTQNGECEHEDMYVRLLEENPKNVEALKVAFDAKMRRGKTKEAVEYVERLIDVEPKEVEWRLLQALCYEMLGQLSKAKRLFKDILKEKPLLLRALHGLAMVMHKNYEGPAVFEMLSKALEIACREKKVTEERNIRILIAQMHVVKGELEEGLKQFQTLVDENPRDFRPYLCQGIIYSLLDKKNEAEEQFKTYRSLVPEEFPQRGFLDDVVLAAKAESRQHVEDFKAEFSDQK